MTRRTGIRTIASRIGVMVTGRASDLLPEAARSSHTGDRPDAKLVVHIVPWMDGLGARKAGIRKLRPGPPGVSRAGFS